MPISRLHITGAAAGAFAGVMLLVPQTGYAGEPAVEADVQLVSQTSTAAAETVESGKAHAIMKGPKALIKAITKIPAKLRKKNIKRIKKAAAKGDLHAKWRLARIYSRGQGVKTNHAEAFKLLKEIVRHHNPSGRYSARTSVTVEALVDMAGYLRTGIPEAGVRKNPHQAFKIYQKAATDFRHSRAQYELGRMLISGDGVNRNTRAGMFWVKLAAKKRHFGAQVAIGQYRLKDHKGVKTDRSKGLMWLSLARDNARNKTESKKVSGLYESALGLSNDVERSRAKDLAAGWKLRFGAN